LGIERKENEMEVGEDSDGERGKKKEYGWIMEN